MKLHRQFSCFLCFKFMAWHSKLFFFLSRMSGLQHMRMKWRRLAAGVVVWCAGEPQLKTSEQIKFQTPCGKNPSVLERIQFDCFLPNFRPWHLAVPRRLRRPWGPKSRNWKQHWQKLKAALKRWGVKINKWHLSQWWQRFSSHQSCWLSWFVVLPVVWSLHIRSYVYLCTRYCEIYSIILY